MFEDSSPELSMDSTPGSFDSAKDWTDNYNSYNNNEIITLRQKVKELEMEIRDKEHSIMSLEQQLKEKILKVADLKEKVKDLRDKAADFRAFKRLAGQFHQFHLE